MGMYTDQERRINVRIPESLVGTFIDQFGKWIDIKEEAICQHIESADNEHNEKAEEKEIACDILCGQIKCIIRMAYRTWQRGSVRTRRCKGKNDRAS